MAEFRYFGKKFEDTEQSELMEKFYNFREAIAWVQNSRGRWEHEGITSVEQAKLVRLWSAIDSLKTHIEERINAEGKHTEKGKLMHDVLEHFGRAHTGLFKTLHQLGLVKYSKFGFGKPMLSETVAGKEISGRISSQRSKEIHRFEDEFKDFQKRVGWAEQNSMKWKKLQECGAQIREDERIAFMELYKALHTKILEILEQKGQEAGNAQAVAELQGVYEAYKKKSEQLTRIKNEAHMF